MLILQVDFIWVTRTFDALEWFLDVLSELEEEEALLGEEERFINIALHITSALGQSDIRAVALQMALELCYREESRDPLCGLRTRIQPGRPNWKKVQIALPIYLLKHQTVVYRQSWLKRTSWP